MNQALKASCHMTDPLPDIAADAKSEAAFEPYTQRLDELMTDYERAVAENDRLRSAIRKARLYAGEHLPAATGTGIVHILESALKEAS